MTTSPQEFSDHPEAGSEAEAIERAGEQVSEPKLDDVRTDDRSRDNAEHDPTATAPGGEASSSEPPD